MTNIASDRPYDDGLQAERTLLAWRRTCLALAVGNAAGIRSLWDSLGSLAALLGIGGLVLTAIAWIVIIVRYRRVHRGLERDGIVISGGGLPLITTAAVLLACVAVALLTVTQYAAK